jgi:hypothetical protein
MSSPFEVTKRIGNSYEVKLPDSLKVYNVFSADRLRKDQDDPLPGQIIEPQPPIIVSTKDEWEVQEVLASKTIQGRL